MAKTVKKKLKTARKDKLTPKMERFCQEYILDYNGTQAAKRAGYKEPAAYAMAAENLRKPQIQARITELQQAAAQGYSGLKNRLILEMQRIATFDIRKLYDEVGNLLPPDKWDDDTAAAVSGLDTAEFIGLGTGFVKKVKNADKTRAAELLSRMLGFDAPVKTAFTDPTGKQPATPIINIKVVQPEKDPEDD